MGAGVTTKQLDRGEITVDEVIATVAGNEVEIDHDTGPTTGGRQELGRLYLVNLREAGETLHADRSFPALVGAHNGRFEFTFGEALYFAERPASLTPCGAKPASQGSAEFVYQTMHSRKPA